MRLALGLGVWTVTLLVSRLMRAPGASPWLWMAVFGVATAWFLPGLSPYFVFPALVAAVSPLIAPAATLCVNPGGTGGCLSGCALARDQVKLGQLLTLVS